MAWLAGRGKKPVMTTAIATSQALDLSSLPAPDIVEQLDYEAILTALQADLLARWPEFSANLESDPVVKLLQVVAYREMVLRQQFNDRALGTMLAFAGGSNLDHLAALFGVTRLELIPANVLTGAAAVMEADEDLRRRVLLAPDGFSIAGPASAYVFHALGAAATISDASATSPLPGEVLVSVLSRDGDGTASPAEIAAVEAVVQSDGIRPLTDLVTVASAQIQPYNVTAQLTLFAGPDAPTILASAIDAVTAHCADARRLGRDVPRSALIAALHVGGVQKVVLAEPAADVVCNDVQAGHAAAIAVTVAGFGE